ncbi:hypothetical protein GCWU000341_02845 [Oribacterium sp. oral taxon 078 str. F0262]|nr:hypothetical protein GCWU000341_02845 [Oribacterium sp. oral taxon 078 str. F0262]
MNRKREWKKRNQNRNRASLTHQVMERERGRSPRLCLFKIKGGGLPFILGRFRRAVSRSGMILDL